VTQLAIPDGDGTILATGDTFVTDPLVRDRLAERAHLVDMEGFAVAAACAALDVPVRLAKHVSDAADDSAWDWPSVVDASARVLGAWVAETAAGRSSQAGERLASQATSGKATSTSTTMGRKPRA